LFKTPSEFQIAMEIQIEKRGVDLKLHAFLLEEQHALKFVFLPLSMYGELQISFKLLLGKS
jgi:hypothetical protein